MPQIITSQDTPPPARIALYGPPKTGKSWLAMSVPDEGRWKGDIIYVAADPGSEDYALSNPRHIIVKLVPQTQRNGRQTYDPYAEAITIASKDWRKDFPNASTLVWDTMTHTARETLSAIADSGTFSDKHAFIGQANTDSYAAAPMPGDYGAAQRATRHLLGFLFRQPLNLIVVWHGDLVEPNSSDTGIVVGGPASVGKAAVTEVAGLFNNLFRTECRTKVIAGNPPKQLVEYVAHTQKKGPWMAGIRLRPGQLNSLPEMVITDPTEFWLKVDAIHGAPQEVAR
jgi:hypothetical protein